MRYKLGLWIIFLIAFYSITFAQSNSGWVTIDSLHEARVAHASVLLPNGNILVSGNGADSITASCEIYETSIGRWRYTKPMNVRRQSHSMVLLKTGKILAIGGYKERSCELFDPVTETWTMTDSIPTLRFLGQCITELKNGKILVSGGFRISNVANSAEYLAVCEIYDPVSEKWSYAASLNVGRSNHTATLLESGEVLIAGGTTKTIGSLRSCEMYDPVNNLWSIIASLNETRSDAASILLPNGNVFISGGRSLGVNVVPWKKNCEVFDIKKMDWSYSQDMHDFRVNHQIFYLSKKNVFLIFGGAVAQTVEDTWETFDPVNLIPLSYGVFPAKKLFSKNAVKLKDDRIILIGGEEFDFSYGLPYSWASKSCLLFDIMTSVTDHQLIPEDYTLFQNYPNPFNPTTEIKYSLPKSDYTKLDVYDALGRFIISLVNSYQNTGSYQIQFNANELPSGIYFYRLFSGTYSKTKKMLFIK